MILDSAWLEEQYPQQATRIIATFWSVYSSLSYHVQNTLEIKVGCFKLLNNPGQLEQNGFVPGINKRSICFDLDREKTDTQLINFIELCLEMAYFWCNGTDPMLAYHSRQLAKSAKDSTLVLWLG